MDPVSAAFTAVTIGGLALKTAEEFAQFIQRLQDHQRTLEQAEADRRAASAELDPPAAAD